MRLPRLPRRGGASRADVPPARAGTPDADEFDRQRAAMVAEQLEARGIRDDDVLDAFRAVPRHAFVDGDDPYGDRALPIDAGQTISQPYVVARMTVTARPSGPNGFRGAEILEVGTGSGYQAAVLAELGGRVTSVERHQELATEARRRLDGAGYGEDRVRIVVGDGTEGLPGGAPYRSIMVTAGGPAVPQPLVDQLDSNGGRLVMPVGDRHHQILTLVERHDGEVTSAELEPVVFVPLIGRYGVAEG